MPRPAPRLAPVTTATGLICRHQQPRSFRSARCGRSVTERGVVPRIAAPLCRNNSRAVSSMMSTLRGETSEHGGTLSYRHRTLRFWQTIPTPPHWVDRPPSSLGSTDSAGVLVTN